MIKLKATDVYMKDIDFARKLWIEEETEDNERFELIMNSVCNNGGKYLSKEQQEKMDSKFKEECKPFKGYMKNIEVRPLRRSK